MAQQVITFHYELKGEDKKVIDSSKGKEPILFLEGANQIIIGLEEVLSRMQPSTSQEVAIPCEDAYGPYDQSLVAQVPRNQFPETPIKVGDVFQIEKEGMIRLVTIVDVTDQMVTIDANHPLAGKKLYFWVELIGRRDATLEEIAHGHAHGHGCGH